MVTNHNVETGIAHGVVDARDYQESLYDDITTHGESLTYNAWKKETIATIAGALESAMDDMPLGYPAPDYDELATEIFDNQEWDYQADEEEYEYTDDKGNDFLLSYLGGAPLIWCIKTSKIVRAKRCSPCVPGAGDLNNLDDDGAECYGVPDEYTPDARD